MPPGLTFDPATRMISGTPPADVLYDESYPFTYRAEDSDGDSAELTFTIVIAAMPSFVREEEDHLYPAGDAVSLELPEAEGGNVDVDVYAWKGSCLRGCRLMAWLGRFRVRRRRM